MKAKVFMLQLFIVLGESYSRLINKVQSNYIPYWEHL